MTNAAIRAEQTKEIERLRSLVRMRFPNRVTVTKHEWNGATGMNQNTTNSWISEGRLDVIRPAAKPGHKRSTVLIPLYASAALTA